MAFKALCEEIPTPVMVVYLLFLALQTILIFHISVNGWESQGWKANLVASLTVIFTFGYLGYLFWVKFAKERVTASAFTNRGGFYH